ncbi:hypothetical protein J3E64_000587 [Sphingobium sp. OAS761]|uniref:hypothetical protein n=1 Tax=Sphingobium sp. OAS761 TaxID=2817901 RepID=UPI00209DC1E9|nr:hypothetical protein [Sphingobium sp. OAS761]MCP1468916.1 hypothetical protein [Sphingobium sp. OAS761]
MNGELRILGLAHGLILGMLLASPMVAPGLLAWWAQALFVLAGFQLRLTDRRWDLRGGLGGWVSHIRMAPRRLIPWAAAAVSALIAGQPEQAASIGGAALLCEMLVYPVCAHLLGQPSHRAVGAILLLLIAISAASASQAMLYAVGFLTGVTACVFWLRGPDGDPRAIAVAATTMVVALAAFWIAPGVKAPAFLTATTALMLTLAHMSLLRRRPVPWQPEDGRPASPVRRSAKPLP